MHAYLICTNNKEINLKSFLPKLAEPIFKHYFTKLKIDDVHALNSFLLTSGAETHIIYFETFLELAQNAFLKTIEEPSAGKQIVLVTKSRAGILDTLLSRLNVIDNVADSELKLSNFLELSIVDRLEVVKNILNKDDDEVRPGAQNLINQILSTNTETKFLTSQQKQTLAQLHDHLFDSGTSAKQILEFLAVTL